MCISYSVESSACCGRDIFGEGTPSFLSARRLLSLAEKGGDDDMFSSDLTHKELSDILGHMASIPTLFLQSGADEYVPPLVDIDALTDRMKAAIGDSAESAIFPGADHALNGYEEEAVNRIVSFCLKLPRLQAREAL